MFGTGGANRQLARAARTTRAVRTTGAIRTTGTSGIFGAIETGQGDTFVVIAGIHRVDTGEIALDGTIAPLKAKLEGQRIHRLHDAQQTDKTTALVVPSPAGAAGRRILKIIEQVAFAGVDGGQQLVEFFVTQHVVGLLGDLGEGRELIVRGAGRLGTLGNRCVNADSRASRHRAAQRGRGCSNGCRVVGGLHNTLIDQRRAGRLGGGRQQAHLSATGKCHGVADATGRNRDFTTL